VCHFEEGILLTLGELGRRSGKGYCYPSQAKILGLLRRFYGVRRSRRSLNRALKRLEELGFFQRIRRHKRGIDGTLVLRSTLYKFKGKLYRYMGLALRSSLRFFSVFRVPFSAHNLGRTDQVSIKLAGLPVSIPVDTSQKGGPSGIFPSHPPPSQLEKLRELIKSLP